MDISPTHAAARAAAARLPALQASLDLLVAAPDPAVIQFYTGADPDTGTLLSSVALDDAVGTIDAAARRINLTVPREGQIVAGGAAGCARVLDASGAVWGDATVSATGGAGEIQLDSVDLVQGAFVRIVSAYFQG